MSAERWLALSAAQSSRWFLYRLEPGSQGAHNNAFAAQVRGPLDAETLKAALQILTARHPMLRARFREHEGSPQQCIADAVDVPVEYVDAAGLSDVSLHERVIADCLRPFDLSRAPLLRASLYAVAAQQAVLLLVFDHLIADGWSYWQLLEELGQVLESFPDSAHAIDTAQPGASYQDYVEWQRAWLGGKDADAQRRYWQQELQTPAPVLRLPIERAHGDARAPSEQEVHSVALDARLTQRVLELTSRNKGTLFTTLLAAYEVLLHRYTGHEQMAVGTAMPGRSNQRWDRTVGDFVNPITVQCRLRGDESVAEVLRAVRSSTLAGMMNQEYPFAELVKLLRPAMQGGEHPFFQTMFVFHKARRGNELRELWAASKQSSIVRWGGVELAPFPVQQRGGDTAIPLVLEAIEVQNGLRCDFRYDPQRFEAAAIDRLASNYVALLSAMVGDDQQSIARLPMLSAPERRRILVEFNDAAAVFPRDLLVHQLIEARAANRPADVAVVCESSQITYGELNRRANQVAHRLRRLGLRTEDRVAVFFERSPEMIVAMLGVLKAGGAYVPLEPRYPAQRLRFILEQCEPAAVLTHRALAKDLSVLAPTRIPVLMVDDSSTSMGEAEQNLAPELLELTPASAAYVIYTSGSTGEPKGVVVEHANLVNQIFCHIELCALTREDRMLQFASPAFDSSVIEIFPTLAAGATVVLRPANLSPDENFIGFLREHRVTAVDIPTAFWHHWVRQIELGASIPDQSLRLIVVGGEQVERRRLAAWLATPTARHCRWLNTYGPTETTVYVTAIGFEHGDRVPAGEVPIGRPIANTRIYILDAHRQPVPIGVAGELYVGGAGVARGYLNRDELTTERFIPDPFGGAPDARLYRTGDLGRWLPDGTIEYLGRNDFQVKIRGFRIELGEIETRLAGCAGVREAVVIAREDSPGEKRLVAYVVPQECAELSAAALRAALSQELADYMVPSAFVMLQALPLTVNGKLDRRALPAPDQSAVVSRTYEAPLGSVEVALAHLWQELLGLERVGRHDHFFELGGHSLMAVQLMSRVRQSLGIEIALRELFAHPTLSDFARMAASAGAVSQPAIGLADRSQPLPLSWSQQRLWFLDQLDAAASAAYHMPVGLRLTGSLNRSAVKATLDRVVARHESLRTRFVSVEGTPRQEIAQADVGFALIEEDLSALDEAQQRLVVEERSRTEARERFDLSTGPLIRGRLLTLSEQESVLLVTQHHIISDGWSIGILVREVSALYSAYCQGQADSLPPLPIEYADPLPALPIQYADYAAWQREWLRDETLERQLTFWRDHLRGAPELLALPTDRARPPVQSYAGDRVPVKLSAELTAGLRALSQRHGTTLFMTLLAGWSVLLSRLSGQSDVVIGTPVANRQRAEVEGLIGFFVNTLALRVNVTMDASVSELLAQIKALSLQAYAHQDVPFEQVVEALQPPRTLSHSPLFQSMLALNNTPTNGEVVLPGLQVNALESAQATKHFDLVLLLSDAGDSLHGEIEYATDLFHQSTIQRWVGHLESLLTAMVADAERAVNGLPLLSTSARAQMLNEFNATAIDYPAGELLHELFEAQVMKQPDAVALIFEDQALTYEELNRRANRLAHHLLRLGVRADDRVAICVERSFDMVVGLLGILKAGAAYVPLDPSHPAERLSYMLQDCAPVAVLTQARLSAQLASLTGAEPVAQLMPTTVQLVMLDGEDALPLSDQPDHNPNVRARGVSSRNLAYVIFTSGSTGKPKGVMNEHAGVVNRLRWGQERFRLTSADRVLQKTPFGFDVSVWELFAPLIAGARLVLARPAGHQDPAYLAELIERAGITLVHFVPSMLRLFVEHAPLMRCAGARAIFCSGEALSHSLQMQVLKALPNVELHNLYGPTEAAVEVTHWHCRPDRHAGIVPIGMPIANTRIYILDARHEPVPIGVMGEIYIGGAQVARGYLNQPELTARQFINDPFSTDPDARLYKTGDLARWLADGAIEYLGRNDYQVKIRGFRIELGEIEAKLSCLAGVSEAVVIAAEDASGEKRLVAYVVAEKGAKLSVAALREELSHSLAEYMVPSAFVMLDALPLTASGKLDRRALPAPDPSAVSTRAYEAPVGEVETTIAALWEEMLGLERVGRQDQFFELGGHSLLAVQMMARIRSTFDVELPLAELFKAPVVSALAKAVLTAGVQRFAAEDVARLTENIDQLSEQELRMLLADEA